MDTDAKGQVGGIDSTEAARRKMAGESGAYRCAACGGRSNAEIMREREELAREAEGEKQEEEQVPEELRLAYREDLAKEDGESEKAQASSSGGAAAAAAETGDNDAPTSAATPPRTTEPAAEAPPTQSPTTTTTTAAAPAPRPAAPGAPAVPAPTRTVPAVAPALRQQQRPLDDGVPAWIDKAIYGVLGALAFMILRKFF